MLYLHSFMTSCQINKTIHNRSWLEDLQTLVFHPHRWLCDTPCHLHHLSLTHLLPPLPTLFLFPQANVSRQVGNPEQYETTMNLITYYSIPYETTMNLIIILFLLTVCFTATHNSPHTLTHIHTRTYTHRKCPEMGYYARTAIEWRHLLVSLCVCFRCVCPCDATQGE